MNNFQIKLLWKVFSNITGGDPISKEHFQGVDMCHLGENYISDFTILEDLLDRMDINEKPQDLYDMYELLEMNKTIIMHSEFEQIKDWNEYVPWEREMPFHIIYNCGKSAHLMNQKSFFETVHDWAGVGTYMVHSVPFFSHVESSVLTYTPSFFAKLCGANQYDMVAAYIGTTTTERFTKMDISYDYAGNAYNEKFKFNHWGSGEDKGYKRPAHIGVILRKTVNEPFQLPVYV